MLYENKTIEQYNPYVSCANRTESWHRSHWNSQENQENGFHQIISILTELPDVHSVLDVGCGDGRITEFFDPEQITDYTGIDITPEIVTVANKPYILHADIKTFQPNRTYDAVFAIGSFNMYVPFRDVLAALEAMHNLSNIVTICNISYLETGNYGSLKRKDERQMLRDEGYTVIEHPLMFSNGFGDKYTIIKTH